MPRKRKNKSNWYGSSQTNQGWFAKNKKRQRNRAKEAKLSRRQNRGT